MMTQFCCTITEKKGNANFLFVGVYELRFLVTSKGSFKLGAFLDVFSNVVVSAFIFR